jgi:hypothetical protein
MSPQTPDDGRRDPSRQDPVPAERRNSSHQYWTVPEIAADLRMTERTVWRKFLQPKDGPRLLAYYDFDGEIRIDRRDYLEFKRHCLRECAKPGRKALLPPVPKARPKPA